MHVFLHALQEKNNKILLNFIFRRESLMFLTTNVDLIVSDFFIKEIKHFVLRKKVNQHHNRFMVYETNS